MARKKFVYIIILSLLMNSSIIVNTNDNQQLSSLNTGEANAISSNDISFPKYAPVDEKIRANTIPNSGFEEVDINDKPVDYSISESGYAYQNMHYGYFDAYSGDYVGLIQSQGSYHNYGYSYVYQSFSSPTTELNRTFILDFMFKTINNPATSGSQIHIQLQFYNNSQWNSISYVLSHFSTLSNSTNAAYYDYNSTIGNWHHLNLNITADYEACFGSVGDAYITTIYLYAISRNQATEITEYVVDDLTLDSSVTGNIITDWDFELGGSNWQTYTNSMGEVSITADHTEGKQAANLTIANQITQEGSDYGYARIYRPFPNPYGYYALNPDESIFEFDWKYSDTSNGGYNQRAEFRIRLRSETETKYYIILLGRNQNIEYTSNSSNYCYVSAEYFGEKDSWNHQRVDVYDALEYFGSTNFTIHRANFYIYLGDQVNSSATLLVDDFSFKTYPLGDPGFELDWHSANTFTGWYTDETTNYVNQTTPSHSGDYAANLTSYGGVGQVSLEKWSLFYTVQSGTMTDFWWKIESQTGGSTEAYIRFYLEGSKYLYYYFAAGDTVSLSNSSSYVYYLVDNFNKTKSWFNINRDIKKDIEEAFGENQWNITNVYIRAYASGSDEISILVDDFHFRDGDPPTIDDVSLQNIPKYYDPAVVNIDASDTVSGIDEVKVFYEIDSIWNSVNATYTGTVYEGLIPVAPYGTTINFYVTARDNAGNSIIDNNSGLYYTYVVGDDVDPLVSIVLPLNSSIINGDTLIEIDASDVGSDIDYVEIYDGLTLLDTDTISPYEYLWDTRTVNNGFHTIIARGYDNAGNYKTADSVIIETLNDLEPPLISSVQLIPGDPQYYDTGSIVVGVSDLSSIAEVNLHYKIGTDSWVEVLMNQDGALFAIDIPSADWDTEVLYYVEAIDTFNQTSYEGTEEAPHSYIIGDNIAPNIVVDCPSTNQVISGNITFAIDGSDVGSGIVNAAVMLEEEQLFSTNSVPENFTWNTKDVENGNYTLVFSVRDGAGNTAEIELTYQVENKFGQDLLPIFQNYGVLFGIAGVVIFWGAVQLTLYLIKKRKLAGGN